MSKIEKFRSFMHVINVDAFMLYSKDEFLREYSEGLKNICSFTGTNGLLIITKNGKCPFFTDGRYITQAHNQLDHNTFKIYTIEAYDWIKENLSSTTKLGYYSNYFTISNIRKYNGICELVPCLDESYKQDNNQQIVLHPLKYSGESSQHKCARIAETINKEEAIFLTNVDSISWLLNIRSEKTLYTPHVLCRAILYQDGQVDLFIYGKEQDSKLGDHVNVLSIDKLESVLHGLNAVIVDPETTPVNIINLVQNKRIIERVDPCLLNKAIKNEAEIAGMVDAHVQDAVAVTNFLYWLDNNVDNKISELDAEIELLKQRKRQNLFKQPSFPTISAFNENAAIIHYRASNNTNKTIEKNGLYLIDSGGQYLNGTTDITRTVAIGIPNKEQITYYTMVLKAHIALANAIFPSGTTGGELDIFARQHLWKFGMNYMHGTGHGVGSYLSVHEGPQAISQGNKIKLVPGMVVSNEPGYYIPHNYGIRIENLMYVDKKANNFLCFKQLTCVPYDKRLIDMSMLTKDEINWLNDYNKFVYENLKNHMENKEWLYELCTLDSI
ncbi:aminopeptidase [Wolbachia pipientis]|uniref:Aminopeptidase n=1 Tax=Wolbachia pipientis TaxID=955 RepID=A0A1E7QKF7_WOLPI|nr:aminopeptidase P family protein [Wolbachia pipientis]OEY86962.1 aminopeptidase [Wolbachia pipientis]